MSTRSAVLQAVACALFLGLATLGCSEAGAPAAGDAGSSASGAAAAREVEAACGSCQLGLPGTACELAIRWEGKVYLVDGTGINDHGDSHAADGFCQAVRKAKVSGKVAGERFEVTSFELLP